MKKLIAMLVALAIVITLCMPAAAADSVPCKVTKAVERCVDENGRCIVISGQKMYLFKRNCTTKKWECRKTFRCVYKDGLKACKHYVLVRNEDTDKRIYKKGKKTYEFGIYVDCYEEPLGKETRIHSYPEIDGKVYKDSAHNTCGFAVCLDNAYYIWKYYGDGTALMWVD